MRGGAALCPCVATTLCAMMTVCKTLWLRSFATFYLKSTPNDHPSITFLYHFRTCSALGLSAKTRF